MGVDEIYFGKQMKFITVVSNLETGEPLWFGQDRKQETLDEFFRTQLNATQRKRMEAACVDMWRPFTNSIEQWARNCRIVYDKFHVLQHANKAIDEVRRAEFFRKGGRMRGVVKGKRWLLLTRWMNLDGQETTAIKRSVRPQPEGDESLSSKGKLGAACGPTAMKEPCFATCRAGSMNCAGNGWRPFKNSPRCWWITWTGS